MKTIRKWTLAVIIIVVIVGVVGATVYLTRRQVTPSFALAPSTLVAAQGANITFTVYGLESNGVATVRFGDGHEASTTSTLTYAYQNPGRYLAGAEEFVGGQSVASTFDALQTIQVIPRVNESVASLISVPVIAFDEKRNPSAPVVQVGDQAYLYGGFLEPPTGSNTTITRYDWTFGNGVKKTVPANGTSLNPLENPTTISYAQPGLYPVTLTLVTENSTNMATYNTLIEQTIAVGSASQAYALFLYAGVVPNPSVINIADNWGPSTYLDPDLDYDMALWPISQNIFSTLLVYNGSSTTNFIPIAASEVPSLSNGGISPDYTSYTFHIRPGLRFSNGDPLTAYDAYYSIVRSLLFRGSNGAEGNGTPAWIMSQYLIPGGTAFSSIVANSTDTAGYNSIVDSMAYSNSSDTITFKLVQPFAPELLFSALAEPLGASIFDSRWLQRIGAGITFTPAGFYAYENEGNQGDFNMKVMNDPIGSGPYMIQSWVPGQSISLVPNPQFPGIPGNPGIPMANDTIVIQYFKYPQTSYGLFQTGQADILTAVPPDYFPLIKQQVAIGQASIYEFPSLSDYMIYLAGWWGPSMYNETHMKSSYGPQYHMPPTYFLNLNVRKAFAYAFDYNYFLDEVLGNKRYGVDSGSGIAGAGNMQGMPYNVPESELQNVPVYNLTYAKQLLEESGEYNTSIDIPFAIPPCYVCYGMGNKTEFAMVQMYAAAIHSIDPNILITPVADNSSAPFDAKAIHLTGSIADYPAQSDVVDLLYQDSLTPGWLNSSGYPDQAATFTQINALIQQADSTTNATLAALDYKQMEQLAINLYLYVYLDQANSIYVVKPYMTGYQGQISYVMNPMGWYVIEYVWWVKTCGSTQACSGRNIGP